MDIKINKKIEAYIDKYKAHILSNICEKVKDDNDIENILNNYGILKIFKEDLNKKTRLKNNVNLEDRCQALRANNSQCTRRKQKNSCFCGTHIKGTPYGKITENDTLVKIIKEEINIYTKEIKGITYYIDDNGNIYSSEDILSNNNNPNVIGHYLVKKDDEHNLIYERV
mgnify:CR=1 FL=1